MFQGAIRALDYKKKRNMDWAEAQLYYVTKDVSLL